MREASRLKNQRKIRVAISACLLGAAVRYDGRSKEDPVLVRALTPHIHFVPVCPETECGMGIPREPMRLEGDFRRPRLVTHHSRIDRTDCLEAWCAVRLGELEAENLCGCIFKTRSPSCGMRHLDVFDEKGMSARNGVGIFARMFMERFPHMPVAEEDSLYDPVIRDVFLRQTARFHRERPHV